VKDSRPQIQRLAPGGISRSGAMLLDAALLACAAVLIAVHRRGLLDLNHVASETLSWSGLALALVGGVYFVYIWWTDRFRASIGHLMVAVAMSAILFAFILHMLRTEQQRRGLRNPSRASSAGGQVQLFVPRLGALPNLALQRTPAAAALSGNIKPILGGRVR